MKECTNCGCINADSDRFCSSCGAALPEPETAYTTPEQPGGYQQSSGYQQPTGYQQPDYQQPTGYQQPTYYPPTGYQQPVGYQPPGYQAPAGPIEGMPSKGLYTALFIISFLLGCLWGLLAIAPYTSMNKAITAGDVETAKKNARWILILFILGVVANVVILLISLSNS